MTPIRSAKLVSIACLLPLTVAVTACNKDETEDTVKLETTLQKASYSYGVETAQRLKEQGITLDMAALQKGMSDISEGNDLMLDDDARRQAMIDFQSELRQALVDQQAKVAEANLAEGKAFLEANSKKDGVVTTESGLQYMVIESGDGPQPTADDTVTTHYHGTLIDGRVFDSSVDRGKPATFPVSAVIKGWTEALQMMHVGDKWKLFVPADLAYGATKRSELIQPNTALIFEVELLGIKGQEANESESEE